MDELYSKNLKKLRFIDKYDKYKQNSCCRYVRSVDSSVAAYLLKNKGYKVQGLFMQNWQNIIIEVCTSEIDFEDASKVCDQLDIPLHKANFSDEYWDRVFKIFSEHEKGEHLIQIFYVIEKSI